MIMVISSNLAEDFEAIIGPIKAASVIFTLERRNLCFYLFYPVLILPLAVNTIKKP